MSTKLVVQDHFNSVRGHNSNLRGNTEKMSTDKAEASENPKTPRDQDTDRRKRREKDPERRRDKDRSRRRDRENETEEERRERRERRRRRREGREKEKERNADPKDAPTSKKTPGLEKAAAPEAKHSPKTKPGKKDKDANVSFSPDLMDMGGLGGGEKQQKIDEVEKEVEKEEEERRRERRHRRRHRSHQHRHRDRTDRTESEERRRRRRRERRRRERESEKAKQKQSKKKQVKKGTALATGDTQRFLDALDKDETYITIKDAKKQSKLEKAQERARTSKKSSSYDLPAKTTLYQGRIRSPEEAPEIFQSVTFTKVPLVLIPDDRSTCSFWFVNPSGHYGITQRKGVSTPSLTKEGKNYACSWTRVAYCVSQQTTTYSCPVRRCPTFDNVNIDVNIKLIFRIGADPTDVKNFAYLLGASRFDEFLHVSVQEAIRTLVRSSYWSEARDLFHTHPGVTAILKGLNRIFNFFGVFFEQSIITDVVFSNPELRQTLQATTAFQSKVKEHKESVAFRVKTNRMMLKRHLTKLATQHKLNLKQLEHEKRILKAKRNAVMVELEKEQAVAIAKAQLASESALIRAQREVDAAKADAMAEAQVVFARERIARMWSRYCKRARMVS